MRHRLIISFIFIFFLVPVTGLSQTLSDFLILEDIGSYRRAKPEKMFPGEPPTGGPRVNDSSGIIAATGHFADHNDKTYEVMYLGATDNHASPTVQVTQHEGGDSDRWLLHEVEDGFRDPDNLEAGPSKGARLRMLFGNKIFFYGGGIVGYSWNRDNIVVNIEYTNLGPPKPEPLEIIQVYLQKHPSTIPSTLVLDKAHDEQWLKDEMERRLWLCDKWFQPLDEGKSDLAKTLREVVNDHLEVFLNYREKYYEIDAENDKQALSGYLAARNDPAIRSRLNAYKTWWDQNKGNSINLP